MRVIERMKLWPCKLLYLGDQADLVASSVVCFFLGVLLTNDQSFTNQENHHNRIERHCQVAVATGTCVGFFFQSFFSPFYEL